MPKANTSPYKLFNYLWLLIIPLSYNFWGSDPALYHKFLLIDISLLAVVIMLFTAKSQLPALSVQTYVFTGLYFISILLALVALNLYHVNNADGWFVWLHLLVFPVFVLLLCFTGNTALQDRQSISEIISGLAAISIVISGLQYGFEVYNTGLSFAASDAVKGAFAHKNIFGEVMFLTLPFTFYTFISTRKKWYALLLIATVVMIALSLSRAVLSAIIIAGFLSAVIYVIANFKQQIQGRYLAIASVAAIIITVIFYVAITGTHYGQQVIRFYDHRGTVQERHNLWVATVQLIKTYPVFGCGLGAWKILSMQYSMLGLRNYITFFQQPHNDFLWILSEQGILSFIFLAAAWLYLLLLLLRNIFRKPAEVFNYCLLFGLTGYAVYSNFGFPRERAEHGIILAFMASFILREGNVTVKRTLPRFALPAIAVLLMVAAWWAGNKMMCEIYMRNALEYRELNDQQEEFNSLQKINSTYYTLDGTATPVAWYRGMIYFTQNNNAAALAEFKEAVKYNPYHAYSLTNAGACFSATGDNDSAEQYFRQALTCAQGFPDAALNMCAIKFNKHKIDSAAWYLSMANDSLTDTRYVKFLGVLTTALVKPVMDSATLNYETSLIENCNNLLTHPQWQMDLFRKAWLYKRPVQQQIWMDVLWIVKYKDGRGDIAAKYQKSFSLPAI